MQPSLIGRYAVVAVGPLVKAYSLDTCVKDPAYTGACLPAWSVNLGSPASTPVGIDGTKVAVALANGDMKILNLSTGKTLFTANLPTATPTMPAVGPTSLYYAEPAIRRHLDGYRASVTGLSGGRLFGIWPRPTWRSRTAASCTSRCSATISIRPTRPRPSVGPCGGHGAAMVGPAS